MGERGGMGGEIPEPKQLYHEKKEFTLKNKATQGGWLSDEGNPEKKLNENRGISSDLWHCWCLMPGPKLRRHNGKGGGGVNYIKTKKFLTK